MKNFVRQARKSQPRTEGRDAPFLSKKRASVVPFSKSPKRAQKLSFLGPGKGQDAAVENGSQVLQHVVDADNMTATALQKNYKSTFISWRNMKERVNTHAAVIDPEFVEFADFLRCMGPRPDKHFTLDRIDNDNPRYGPNLCAWRDKDAQNNNKGNTIYLTNVDGVTQPLTHWAKIKGQKPDTMRKRRLKGWSDADLIAGKQTLGTNAVAPSFSKSGPGALDIWPGNSLEAREWWEEQYQSKRKARETRNQFLLRRVGAMLHEIGEREGCNDPSDLPDDLRAKVERMFRIVEECEKRERQARASREARASELRHVDPYA